MKNLIKFLFIGMLSIVCLSACEKPMQDEHHEMGWLDSVFVAPAKNDLKIDNHILAGKTITPEQFAVIVSNYTGQKTVSELASITECQCVGESRSNESLNTILKRGISKRIKSSPEITEYLLSNLGTYQNPNAANNFYSVGTSKALITWQDAANSAFAENLTEITDFNPELIEWDSLIYWSGCTYSFNYSYPITLNTGQVLNAPGESYMHATCDNETLIDGEPNFPLNDYYIEVPVLGTTNQLYFQN